MQFGVMYFALWLVLLAVPSVLCASRYMDMTNGKYCAGSTLQPPVGITGTMMKCTIKCLETAACVAVSYRADSQCLLHDAWCSAGDLLTDPAAVYAEVHWECEKRSCYNVKSLKTPKTKPEAEAVCAALGAHVAAPETAAENQFINAIATQPAYYTAAGLSPSHWINLMNDVTWAHSGQPATYFNWGPNEPSGASEPYALMNKLGTWQDYPSHVALSFICEREW